jgi:5'-nucleotidase
MIRSLLRRSPVIALIAGCQNPPESAEPQLVALQAALLNPAASSRHAGCGDHADDAATAEVRDHASHPVRWRGRRHPGRGGVVPVRLLGINDFHGRLSEGLLVSGRPVGGAAVLASYVRAATEGFEGRSLLVHAGDLRSCRTSRRSSSSTYSPTAIVAARPTPPRTATWSAPPVTTNFDQGSAELSRLVFGGDHEAGPFLQSPWAGARFPHVSANVVRTSGESLLPPYVIVKLGGVPVGVIGAVLKETPTIVTPTGVAGLELLDESTQPIEPPVTGRITHLN